MLDESEISASIENYNIAISKKQKEIDEDKKNIRILQAKLKEINRILQDE